MPTCSRKAPTGPSSICPRFELKYQVEILIDKPLDQVVALFDELDNLGAWQPGFQSWEHLHGEKGQPGAQTRLVYLNGKRRVEMVETLEVYNLPEEFTATFEAPGMKMWVQSRFEAVGEQQTRWISNNDGSVSGVMMSLVRLLMPGCFKKESMRFMRHFKDFAEQGIDLRNN